MQWRHCDKEYKIRTVECRDLGRDTFTMKVAMVERNVGLREVIKSTFRQGLRWWNGVVTR